MKRVLNKIIPSSVILQYKKWYKRKDPEAKKFEGKNAQEIFTEIYQTNHWTSPESISGPGSDSV